MINNIKKDEEPYIVIWHSEDDEMYAMFDAERIQINMRTGAIHRGIRYSKALFQEEENLGWHTLLDSRLTAWFLKQRYGSIVYGTP